MVYLVPSLLAVDAVETIPPYVVEKIRNCEVIFAENIRTVRRFLKQMDVSIVIDDYQWFEIKKDETSLLSDFRSVAKQDKHIAIVSEAGCPGVADPGHFLIAEAHKLGQKVVPLVGPSSILLALMASGMNGQQFIFHGYLPIDSSERTKTIKKLEEQALKTGYTQLFIETPYRNDSLLRDILKTCHRDTRLCVASEVTGKDEFIKTMSVSDWRKETISLHKKTAIFLLSS